VVVYDTLNMHIAASFPTVSGIRPTDVCVLEGNQTSLSCEVTYNGTNLMPMKMRWRRYAWNRNSGQYYSNYRTINTVNTSSVYHSSYTYAASEASPMASGQALYYYTCEVTFSSPTGIVISGVQRQYSNVPYNTLVRSSSYIPRTTSEWIVVKRCVSFIS